MVLFTCGLFLLVFGARHANLPLVSIGGGLWLLGSAALLKAEPVLNWYRRVTQFLRLATLRIALWRDAEDILRARPWCAAFAIRYPAYVRLPFRLAADDRLRLAPLKAERLSPFQPEALPRHVIDLEGVLAVHGIHFASPLHLVLVVNREVWSHAREKIESEVVKSAALVTPADLQRLIACFATWEIEQERLTPGRSLLFREVLVECLLERAPAEWIAHCLDKRGRNLTQSIDHSIARARDDVQRGWRTVHLERELRACFADEGGRSQRLVAEVGEGSACSVASLADMATQNLAQVTQTLQRMFLQGGESLAIAETAYDEGYFVAMAEGQRVLLQIGWVRDDVVPLAAVERAALNSAKEYGRRVVLLALGAVTSAVLSEADRLGVLVLLPDALDRLLQFRSDRMHETVEWSLHTSQRANQNGGMEEKNATVGLELTAST